MKEGLSLLTWQQWRGKVHLCNGDSGGFAQQEEGCHYLGSTGGGGGEGVACAVWQYGRLMQQ